MKSTKETVIIGKKFGKLTVQTYYDSLGDRLCVCICDCGQTVPTTARGLQEKSKYQCLNCDEREMADNFKINEIVVVRFGPKNLLSQQGIVSGTVELEKQIFIEVELFGRIHNLKPSYLIGSGMIF